MSAEAPDVEFYFDPICPWCWMTSRWASEVAQVRGFEIDWRPVTLAIVNENNELSGSYAELMKHSEAIGRVVEAARLAEGDSILAPLYTAIGTRLHPGGRKDYDAVVVEALAELGLDPSLAEASGDGELDAQLRENTHHALEIAGPDVGVPVISIDGAAFFGPVMTPAPTGEPALQLWDGIAAAASVPGFYELKRGRTMGPQF